MGDHFWPAVYPGLAVGLFYGLYLSGLANVVLGSLGGLAAAFVAFSYFDSFFAEEGVIPLAGLLIVSLLGAIAVTQAAALLSGRREANSP